MKLGFIVLFISIFILICNPSLTIQGALRGWNTWLFGLVPTLLPFMIFSNFILSQESLSYLKSLLPKQSWLKEKNLAICFNILAGLTFGLPVGAKITTTLLENKLIEKREGQILLNHCNTIGPAFVGGYLLTNHLHRSHWVIPSLLILYLPQLLVCIVRLFAGKNKAKQSDIHEKIKISRLKSWFEILDISIVNGFETIVLLGGYLVLFGILCIYISQIPFVSPFFKAIVIAGMEITTGIREIALLPVSVFEKYLLCMTFAAFGGICTLLQTYSITKECGLSVKKYLYHKITFGCITALIISLVFLLKETAVFSLFFVKK